LLGPSSERPSVNEGAEQRLHLRYWSRWLERAETRRAGNLTRIVIELREELDSNLTIYYDTIGLYEPD
jgi:hypothetical protein